MAGRDFYVLCSDHKILVDIAIKSRVREIVHVCECVSARVCVSMCMDVCKRDGEREWRKIMV